MITLTQIKDFFNQEGINVKGICREFGLSYDHVVKILNKEKPLTKNYAEKIKPALIKYGHLKTE